MIRLSKFLLNLLMKQTNLGNQQALECFGEIYLNNALFFILMVTLSCYVYKKNNTYSTVSFLKK